MYYIRQDFDCKRCKQYRLNMPLYLTSHRQSARKCVTLSHLFVLLPNIVPEVNVIELFKP